MINQSIRLLTDLWKVLVVDKVPDLLREVEEVHEGRDDGVDDGVVKGQRHGRAHDASKGRVVVGQIWKKIEFLLQPNVSGCTHAIHQCPW